MTASDDLTEDDVRAMRREGDFSSYLRELIREGERRRDQQAKTENTK